MINTLNINQDTWRNPGPIDVNGCFALTSIEWDFTLGFYSHFHHTLHVTLQNHLMSLSHTKGLAVQPSGQRRIRAQNQRHGHKTSQWLEPAVRIGPRARIRRHARSQSQEFRV